MDEIEIPRIKVCGFVQPDEAVHAALSGADAIGIVHYPPSPRHVEDEAARAIVEALPASVLSVLVLVDADRADAEARADRIGAGCLQLCGHEDPAEWQDCSLPILRRLGVREEAFEELERWQGVAGAFILEHPDEPGGSGDRVDEELAGELACEASCLLAGGLDGHRVRGAVLAVRPHGVDASSRLEWAPGRKDPALVRTFIRRARQALDALES